MLLFDYIYFQSYHWMKLQGRKHPEEAALGIVLFIVGFYVMGAIALASHLLETNIPKLVADAWPIDSSGRYLRPRHGLGVIVTALVTIWVLLIYRKGRRQTAVRTFRQATAPELALGPSLVTAAFFSSPALAVTLAFKIFWAAWALLAVHGAAYAWIRLRYPHESAT